MMESMSEVRKFPKMIDDQAEGSAGTFCIQQTAFHSYHSDVDGEAASSTRSINRQSSPWVAAECAGF